MPLQGEGSEPGLQPPKNAHSFAIQPKACPLVLVILSQPLDTLQLLKDLSKVSTNTEHSAYPAPQPRPAPPPTALPPLPCTHSAQATLALHLPRHMLSPQPFIFPLPGTLPPPFLPWPLPPAETRLFLLCTHYDLMHYLFYVSRVLSTCPPR